MPTPPTISVRPFPSPTGFLPSERPRMTIVDAMMQARPMSIVWSTTDRFPLWKSSPLRMPTLPIISGIRFPLPSTSLPSAHRLTTMTEPLIFTGRKRTDPSCKLPSSSIRMQTMGQVEMMVSVTPFPLPETAWRSQRKGMTALRVPTRAPFIFSASWRVRPTCFKRFLPPTGMPSLISDIPFPYRTNFWQSALTSTTMVGITKPERLTCIGSRTTEPPA